MAKVVQQEDKIPEGWIETTLGEVADITMGQSPAGDTCSENSSGVPLLNGPTEFGFTHPTPVQFTVDAKKISLVNDLLFCVRGSTTGRMNWSDQKYALGRGVASIRHKSGQKYRKYIRGIFDFKLSALLAEATGSTFPNVSKVQLENIEVLLPPLPEQKAIADVLSSFDDKIELLREQNKALEKAAQTIFKEWFGKYSVDRPEELPEGWKFSVLGDISDHVKDSVRPFEKPDDIYLHYSLPAFDNGLKPVAEKGFTIKSNKYQVVENSFLVSKLNPFTPRIWTIFEADISNICSTEFQVVKPLNDEYFSLIYCFLKSNKFTANLSQKIKGTSSSHQRVSPQDIFNSTLVVPDKGALREFDLVAGRLARKVDLNQRQIQQLEGVRDILLPELMKGSIRTK